MTNDIEAVIQDLLRELSSELDLHYETEDFDALGPTIDIMKRASDMLEANGAPVPDAFRHILSKLALRLH